jgi:hypothetical protein
MHREVFVRATSNKHLAPTTGLPAPSASTLSAAQGQMWQGIHMSTKEQLASTTPTAIYGRRRPYCPGRQPPFSALQKPARPCKSATPHQTQFTMGNVKGA